MLPPESDAESKDLFFHGGHWGQCLELLTHLCQYSDSILLVTGPNGIGKSSLKQALINNNLDKFVYCELNSNKDLDADTVADLVNKGFDAALQEQLAGSNANPDLLLVIDDAHKISIEVISALLQLKQTLNARGSLHIVLFAQPEFEQAIQRSPLRGKFTELVHTIELEPLTLNEMQAFLSHVTDTELDKVAVKKIYAASGGVPGTVIKLANEMLNGKHVKQANLNLRRWSPFSVGLTVAFGVVFCVLAFLWPDAEEDKFDTASAPVMDLPIQSISANNDLQNEDNIASQTGLATDTSFANSETTVQTAQTNLESTNLPPVNENPSSETVNYDAHAEQLARLENKLIALQQQLDAEKAARNAAEKKAQQIMHKAAEYSKPRSSLKDKSNKAIGYSTRHEKYLLSLPSRNYTLQLLGASNEQKVKQFIVDNKLGADAYYFASTRNGKPWFIVVYGNYPNLSTATKATNLLPPSIQKLKPWAREFGAIQNTINNKG